MDMARLLRDHQRLTAWKVERALVFNDPIRAEEQRLLRPHGIGFHKSYSDAVKRSGHNRYNPCLLLLPVEIRTLIFERTLEQLTDLPSLGYGFRMLVDYYVRFAYVNALFKDITMLTISGNTFHFLDDEPRRHKVLSFNASTREGLFGIHAMYALKTFGFLPLTTIMVTKQYYFHDRARSLRILHDFLPVEELSFPEGDTLWRDIPHDLIERVLSFQPSPLRLRGICDLLADDLRYVPGDLLERARLIRRTEVILFDEAPQAELREQQTREALYDFLQLFGPMATTEEQLDDLRNQLAQLKLTTRKNVPAIPLPKFKGRTDDRPFATFLDEFNAVALAMDWEDPNLGNDSRRAMRFLVRRAFPDSDGINDAVRKKYEVDYFIGGLKPNVKEQLMRRDRPDSLETAIIEAQKEETLQHDIRRDYDTRSQAIAAVRLAEKQQELQEQLDEIKRSVAQPQNEIAFIQSSDRSRYDRFENQRGNPRTFTPSYQPPRFPQSNWNQGRSNNYPRQNSLPRREGQYIRRWGSRASPRDDRRPRFPRPPPGFRSRSQGRGQQRGGFNNRRSSTPWDNRRDSSRSTSFRMRDQPSGNPNFEPQQRPDDGQIRPRYHVNAVRHLQFPMLLLALLAAVHSTLAVEQLYQICSSTKGGLLVERPQVQNCTVPQYDYARMARVTLYVPRVSPINLQAWHCFNLTETVCSHALFGLTTGRDAPRLQRTPITAELCRNISLTRSMNGKQLINATDIWRTNATIIPETAIFGEACAHVSNVYAHPGTIGILQDGSLISDLDDLTGCQLQTGNCTHDTGVVVWVPPKTPPCPYHDVGAYDAVIAGQHVVIEQLQAAFTFRRGTAPVEAARCLPPNLSPMENDALLRIHHQYSGYRDVNRRRRDSDIEVHLLSDDPGQRPQNRYSYDVVSPDTEVVPYHEYRRRQQANGHTTARPHDMSDKEFADFVRGYAVVPKPLTTASPWRRQPAAENRATLPPRPANPEAPVVTKHTPTSPPRRPAPAPKPEALLADARPRDDSNTEYRQASHDVNVRGEYSNMQLQRRADQQFRKLWSQICLVHNHQVRLNEQLMRIDETMGARAWFGRDDIHAENAGEALRISACQQIRPTAVYWNGTLDGKCYASTPVRVDNRTFFIQEGTRDLKPSASTVPCSKVRASYFRHQNGTWVNATGNGRVHVARVPNHLRQLHTQQYLSLHAPAVYDSDLTPIRTSISALSRYVHRINRLEHVLTAELPNPQFKPLVWQDDLKEFVHEFSEVTANTTTRFTNWVTTSWNSVGTLWQEWQHMVYALLAILLVTTGVGLIIYLYPWLRDLRPSFLRRQRQQHIHAGTPQQEGSNVTPSAPTIHVNAMEMQPMLPKPERPPPYSRAPLNTGANIPDFFYPECCLLGSDLSEPEDCRIRLDLNVNGVTADSIVDTGTNLSYCSLDWARRHRFEMLEPLYKTSRMANDDILQFTACIDATVHINDLYARSALHVSPLAPQGFDLVLGTDLLNEIALSGWSFELRFSSREIIHNRCCLLHDFIDPTPYYAELQTLDTQPTPRSTILRNLTGIRRVQVPFIRPTHPRPFIKANIEGREVTCLFDTGAVTSVCRFSLAHTSGVEIVPPTYGIFTTDGQALDIMGRCLLQLELQDGTYLIHTLVAKDEHCPVDLLIGADVLKRLSDSGRPIVFDFVHCSVKIGNTSFAMIDLETQCSTPSTALSSPSPPTTTITPANYDTAEENSAQLPQNSTPAALPSRPGRGQDVRLTIEGRVNNAAVRMFVDTGCSHSYCSLTLMQALGLPMNYPRLLSVTVPNGSSFAFSYSTEVVVGIGHLSASHTIHVTSDEHCKEHFVLGADLLRALSADSWDFIWNVNDRSLDAVRCCNRLVHELPSFPPPPLPPIINPAAPLHGRAPRSTTIDDSRPFIMSNLQGHTFLSLIDTGSSVSMCRYATAAAAGLVIRSGRYSMRTVLGTTVRSLGTTEFTFALPAGDVKVTLYVVPNDHCPSEILFGSDALATISDAGYRVQLSFTHRKLFLGALALDLVDPRRYGCTCLQPAMCALEPPETIAPPNHRPLKRPIIRVEVNGQKTRALFDLGSTITYCRKTVADRLKIANREPCDIIATAANETSIPFLSEATTSVRFGNKVSLNVRMRIAEDNLCPAPVLIGSDVMAQLNDLHMDIGLNWARQIIKIGNEALAMVNAVNFNLHSNPVATASETVILPPHTETFVWATLDRIVPENREYITTHAVKRLPIMVGKSYVSPGYDLRAPLRIRNDTNKHVRVYKGVTLAILEPLMACCTRGPIHVVHATATEPHVPDFHEHITSEDDDDALEPIDLDKAAEAPEAHWEDKLPRQPGAVDDKLKLDDCILSEQGKAELRRLIKYHHRAFVQNDGVIGCYNGDIVHRIDLEADAVPFQQRPNRLPMALRDEVQRQIEDMLRQRIIQPSTSSFCSPIVMVRKADKKSWRFAVDYRKLNANTKKQTYYLPLIQDILDAVGGKRIYSNFDFQSGFHQIPVYPPHIPRTAFATFMGLFEFVRMPFGLCSAPSTFQRVMESMRKELTASFYVYLDDVVLASDTEEEHLEQIDNFLHVITKYGMRLRLDKCRWGQAEIKYLGFLISHNGMRPDPVNVAAVQSFKRPKTLTELRSLIGAVTYFRRFIPRFAEIMSPLYELTKEDNINDKWDNQHETALRTVTHKLVTAPVLAPARFGRPFIVETDASAHGIAACLLQKDDNGEIHPIAYASRKLNKHEARYPSVESEALALTFALKQFAPYLEGSGLSTVRTDNSALCSLLKRKDLTGRFAKYQMAIQHHDILIEHRTGKSNAFCDHISRYTPDPSDVAAITHCDAIDDPQPRQLTTLTQIREAQRQANEYAILYDALKHNRWPANKEREETLRITAANYIVKRGVLYYYDALNEDSIPLIVIPYPLRERILKEFHESPVQGAHLGMLKTVHRLKQRVFWPNMDRDIQQLVRSCVKCQMRKTNRTQVSREPMHPIETPRFPFDRVHVDLHGPLQKTDRNNGYILAAQDALTKWLITIPLPDQRAVTVINALVDYLITQHGVPTVIHTDQGRQFTSAAFKEFASVYGFVHTMSTAYHPEGNGAIERQNRTIDAMLSAYVNREGNNWDQFLSLVTFAHNTAIQATTRQSPFFLNRFREAQLPSDIALSIEPTTVFADHSTFLQEMCSGLRAAWDSAVNAIESAQQRQKQFSDEYNRAQEHEFHLQELVLLFRDQPPRDEAHKFRLNWEGPYRIIGLDPPNVIIRELHETAPTRTVHANKLKKYIEPSALPLRRREAHAHARDATREVHRNPYAYPGDPQMEESDPEDADAEEDPCQEQPAPSPRN